MEYNEVLTDLREAFEAITGIPVDEIKERDYYVDGNLTGYEPDLDLLEEDIAFLFDSIEEDFGVYIDYDLMVEEELYTVGDLCEYIVTMTYEEN